MKSLREQAQEQHTPAWGAVHVDYTPDIVKALREAFGPMLAELRVCPRCDATGRDPDNTEMDCATCDGERMVREEPSP